MLSKYKPGASIRTHLIFAAALWTGVGIMLFMRGSVFLAGVDKLWLVLAAIAAGTGKSLVILDKSASRNAERLAGMKDGACLGSVYSFKMWGLVVFMIVMGRVLRASALPLEFVGVLYAAIGWALFFSSRLLWARVMKKMNNSE